MMMTWKDQIIWGERMKMAGFVTGNMVGKEGVWNDTVTVDIEVIDTTIVGERQIR